MKLSYKGTFAAAHWLEDYDGDCSKEHGHTWKYKITIEASNNQVGPDGILVDFRELKNIVKPLDHGVLNESTGMNNPTAERLAWWIHAGALALADRLGKEFSGIKVSVWESKNAKVTYGE